MMWDDDELYLAARAETIMKMLDMCQWLSEDELVVRLDHPCAKELVKSWVDEHEIFSVPTERGALYPAFQFDSKMRPLKIIKEVLSEFENKAPFATAAWFIFKNGWITRLIDGIDEPVPPMMVLDDSDAVLNAARNEARGTYFA
jgi:hypothetical protein